MDKGSRYSGDDITIQRKIPCFTYEKAVDSIIVILRNVATMFDSYNDYLKTQPMHIRNKYPIIEFDAEFKNEGEIYDKYLLLKTKIKRPDTEDYGEFHGIRLERDTYFDLLQNGIIDGRSGR